MGIGHVGSDLEGGVDLMNRFGKFSALVANDSQEMQAIKVSPFDLKDFSVQLFGFRQQAGPVKCHGLAEHRCDIRLGERGRRLRLPGKGRLFRCCAGSLLFQHLGSEIGVMGQDGGASAVAGAVKGHG
jgi:hypothetical protein